MEQRVRTAEELFREPALREPSQRKRLRVLPSQLARVDRVTLEPDQIMNIERALVEYARLISETIAQKE